MKRQHFDALVRRVEARYAGRPGALERSAWRWVALGRAAAIAWPALFLGLGAACFAGGAMLGGPGLVLLCLGVGLVVFGVIQAGLTLLVDSARAGGVALEGRLPEGLAVMLDGLRDEFRCRPFDEVRVTNEFNAGIREVPRLGLLGWPRTVLEVGLPLALTLPADEMRAVLAHEFAHVSSRHGRGGHRLYRLHRTWGGIFERINEPSSDGTRRAVRQAISKFIDWYWPRLQARMLILSRVHEYQADRLAASVAGGPALVSSLWRMECLGPRLAERFWPDLLAEATQHPEPPDNLFEKLRAAIASSPTPDDAARRAGRAQARATGHDDTHPAFADRARALSAGPEPSGELVYPEPASPSAAEALLGTRLEAIERELAGQWRLEVAASWRLRHRQARGGRSGPTATGGEATATANPNATTPDPTQALWATARETFDRFGSEAAGPYLRDVLARAPAHPGASVLLGHHLLARGDEEGERLLLRVAGLDDDDEWMPRAISILHDHYRNRGEAGPLREIRARLDRHEADIKAARLERSGVEARDRFLGHGLDDDQLRRLLVSLESSADCEAAWLVRKDVKHFPARPLFVLVVLARGPRWGPGRFERGEAIVRRLSNRVELPGRSLVISRRGPFARVAAKVEALPGAEIFRRPRPQA